MHAGNSPHAEYDVIIVGAGPAGCSTALHLARLAPDIAARTLVLEKAHHPRHKLCAGGVIPDAERCLQRLGLDISEVPHVTASQAHFDFAGRGLRMRTRGNPYAFRVVRRDEFDAWLVRKVRERGIEVREGTRVKSIHVDDDIVRVETATGTLRARAVVGADGSNSVVRKAIAVEEQHTHVARALEIITPPRPETSSHVQTDSYFDFLCIPQGILGYVWDFPTQIKGEARRCWGVYDSNIAATEKEIPLRLALAEELRRHGFDLAEYELKGHPIRWFDSRNVFAAPRVVLVGDAAGADVLYGEGISPALGYGEIAAQAIRDAFARQDFSFQDYRQRVLDSPLGKSLRRRTFFARIFYRLRHPTVQAFIWRRLGWLVRIIVNTFLIDWTLWGRD